jgi:hypothetical protein
MHQSCVYRVILCSHVVKLKRNYTLCQVGTQMEQACKWGDFTPRGGFNELKVILVGESGGWDVPCLHVLDPNWNPQASL